MLKHEIINKAENLEGIYFKAFNRICTSIQVITAQINLFIKK